MHIEHIIPLVEGGQSTVENLWLACPLCNGYKREPGNLPGPGGRRQRRPQPGRADQPGDHRPPADCGPLLLPNHPRLLTWLLLLRAFTTRCTAMTGIEAVSNGGAGVSRPGRAERRSHAPAHRNNSIEPALVRMIAPYKLAPTAPWPQRSIHLASVHLPIATHTAKLAFTRHYLMAIIAVTVSDYTSTEQRQPTGLDGMCLPCEIGISYQRKGIRRRCPNLFDWSTCRCLNYSTVAFNEPPN